MRKLISEGFSAIPRAVLNNQDNPDEQERLIANILFIFFRDARFKDGTMALKNAVYPCRRGQSCPPGGYTSPRCEEYHS